MNTKNAFKKRKFNNFSKATSRKSPHNTTSFLINDMNFIEKTEYDSAYHYDDVIGEAAFVEGSMMEMMEEKFRVERESQEESLNLKVNLNLNNENLSFSMTVSKRRCMNEASSNVNSLEIDEMYLRRYYNLPTYK